MILQFWLWLGKKLGFRWVDVKHFKQNKNKVEAVTFSMTERYIDLIQKYD